MKSIVDEAIIDRLKNYGSGIIVVTKVESTIPLYKAVTIQNTLPIYFTIRKKSNPTLRRMTNEYEFGVDLLDIAEYLEHGVSLIFFIDLDIRQVFHITLSHLMEHGREYRGKGFPHGILFIPLTKLEKLGVPLEPHLIV